MSAVNFRNARQNGWRVIPDRVDESTVSERASANDAANLRGSVREGGMFG